MVSVCNVAVGKDPATKMIGESMCTHLHIVDVALVTSIASAVGENGALHNAVNFVIHLLTCETVDTAHCEPGMGDVYATTDADLNVFHFLEYYSLSDALWSEVSGRKL